MNAEFNWWLLIVGLVVGAGLVWFVVLDARRREEDVEETERVREAAWLASTMADEGYDVPVEAAERLLTLHRRYLEAPPPDEVSWVASDGSADQPSSGLADDDRIGIERGATDLRQ